MMNIRFHYLLLLLGSLVATFSLNAQTADVTVGCTPLQVNFIAPAGASSFFWDFKDGGTSDLQNPSNVFIEPGTYEVDFSAMQGGTVLGTVVITVADRTTLSVEAVPDRGCAPLDVEFRNTTVLPDGVSVTDAQWVFDDGTQAMGEIVNRTYATAGSFSVSLSLTTDGPNCDATDRFVDIVTTADGPNVQFITDPNPPASCEAPFTVSFSNQTPNIDNLNFVWDFGNGNTSTEANPAAQTYNTEGDFVVTLSATDPNIGCTTIASQTITIGSPTAAFEVVGAACSNGPVVFQNNSSQGAYSWEFVGVTTSTATNPSINFSTPGEYEVRLTVTSPAGCSTGATQTITVDRADAGFVADPVFSCSEPLSVTFTPNTIIENATYEWDFGDDSTSTEAAVTHDYFADNESPFHENGEFMFMPQLTVTTASGCIDSASTELLLDIPLARFMPDTVSGCAPLTVEFSDSSRSNQIITNWEWIYDNGDINNFSTSDPHNYTFEEPGEYDVILVITNELGCQDTSFSIRVEVGSRITPDFTTDVTEVCQGQSVQFTDATNSDLIDEWRFVTDNDRSSHCFNDANPSIPFETATGTFGVTMIVGYNGCLDSIARPDLITVNGPIAEIGYSIPCDTPNTVTFTNNSDDATTVTWDFGNGATSMEDAPVQEYAVGDYTVILTAENTTSGCPASTDTVNINIRNLTSLGMVELQQCRNLPVSLDATMSVDVDTTCSRGYTWHFNHPSLRPLTTNEPTNMEIAYPDTGNYIIELVVEDVNGCVDTSEYPVRVDEAIADFTMDKSVICFPSLVTFTDRSTSTTGSIESYMWNFGDGIGMDETENPVYVYRTNPGTGPITVTLSIEDAAGCPGEASMTIDTYTPTSQITTDPVVPNICAGTTVNFSATDFTEQGSNLEFRWDVGLGGDEIMTQNTSATYDEGGTYEVILNITEIATNCPGQSRVTVNVQDFPVADFTSSVDGQDPLCHPANISFTNTSETDSPLTSVWDFENGQTGFGNEAASFFPKGVYAVTLNTQTSFGCSDETSRTFNLVGPEGDISFTGGPFCVGDEVTASISSLTEVDSYSWFFEGQEFGANTETITFDVTEVPAGGQAPLTLNLTGPEGCPFARQVNVPVREVVAAFAANGNACSPEITFVNQSMGGSTFNWDFGDGNTSSAESPTNAYAVEGTYEVTLQIVDAASGCTDMITQTVEARTPVEVIARDLDTCIMIGTSIELPIVNNSATALLLFNNENGLTCPDGGSIANCTTPVFNSSVGADYTLTIQDPCFPSQTFTFGVGVFDPSRSLLPNAFTPDGDGTNDFFRVITDEDAGGSNDRCSQVDEILSFQVFNRWGTKVYDDPSSTGWNGDYEGERQNPDVYIYVVELRLSDGTETTLTGDVTLIR